MHRNEFGKRISIENGELVIGQEKSHKTLIQEIQSNEAPPPLSNVAYRNTYMEYVGLLP